MGLDGGGEGLIITRERQKPVYIQIGNKNPWLIREMKITITTSGSKDVSL